LIYSSKNSRGGEGGVLEEFILMLTMSFNPHQPIDEEID